MVRAKTLTKEEESLLQDFGRDVSKQSSIYFYCNAFFAAVIPLYIALTIPSCVVFSIVTGSVTWLLATGYKNTKFLLKHKIFQQKGDVISKDLSRRLANDKNLSKREKDDKILNEKNEVSEYESKNFSIFYINLLYLTAVVVLSSFLVGPMTINPLLNYTFSMIFAAGLSSVVGK